MFRLDEEVQHKSSDMQVENVQSGDSEEGAPSSPNRIDRHNGNDEQQPRPPPLDMAQHRAATQRPRPDSFFVMIESKHFV